ncbi:putative Fe-S oxidoreductase [Thermoplasmatales archaeon BRNA1]|nr:putative Fe-S oxidoreductase [Thermoplasmatales archaeon BRNA1]
MCATVRPYSAATGLPKKTKSLCPECGKTLEATVYEKDGKVFMDKECPEHGKFSDIYWSDAKKYLQAEKYAKDGTGLFNPMDETLNGENVNIVINGEKINMLSPTALANIDLTNRCNMQCPICFASANQAGYVYEPDFETICKMLDTLRNEKPIPCTAVQFSGGEPTVYPQLIEVIRAAKERKFAQVQIATNGIVFAKHYDKLKECAEAGLNTIYLQFDGLDDKIMMRSRGRPMVKVKMDVINNCLKLKEETGHSPSIVLVVTTVRGMNDQAIGDILKFAIKYRKVIRGVNFQPVAFTGRMTREEVAEGRITLTDVAKAVNEQTGYTNMDDWYPVPTVSGISNYASIILGENKITFPTHPHCGLATYLFIDENDNVYPMPEFIDVDKFVAGLEEIAAKAEKATFKKLTALKVRKLLLSCAKEENMPPGMTKNNLISALISIMSKKSKESLAKFSWGMLYVGAMHFQDSFDYDFERVRRCSIHYVTPDCKVIPFCAYNSGIEMRVETEKKFSMPIEEWKQKHKEEAKQLAQALIVPKDVPVMQVDSKGETLSSEEMAEDLDATAAAEKKE